MSRDVLELATDLGDEVEVSPASSMLAALVKRHRPDLPIVVGGPSTDGDPEGVVADRSIDFAVIGEGEATFLDLLRRIGGDEDYAAVPGMAWVPNGHPVRNAPRPPIEDLDALPFPAWDLLDLRAYFSGIRFQMIYCAHGQVRLVYEDQGPPFVLAAGDCVLQPPRIRHRVLESSAGMEVVEVSCPAEHDTFFDHELELPTAAHRPDREFEGMRFLRHVASEAVWRPWRRRGFECRDLGIGAATRGLAAAMVVRRARAGQDSSIELLLLEAEAAGPSPPGL